MSTLSNRAQKLQKCQTRCTNKTYEYEKDMLTKERLRKVVNGESDADVVEKTKQSLAVQNYTSCTLQYCRRDFVDFVGSFVPALKKDIKDASKAMKQIKTTADPNYEFYANLKVNREQILKQISGYKKWDDERLYDVALRLSNRKPYQIFY